MLVLQFVFPFSSKLRSCVKVEVDVLGSPSLCPYGLCGRKTTLNSSSFLFLSLSFQSASAAHLVFNTCCCRHYHIPSHSSVNISCLTNPRDNTHTHTLSLSLSLSYTHTLLSLSLSHTHVRTHARSHKSKTEYISV